MAKYTKQERINYHINRVNNPNLSQEEREKSSKRVAQLENSLKYTPEEKVNYLFKRANNKSLSTGQRWSASRMLKNLARVLNGKRYDEHMDNKYGAEERLQYYGDKMEDPNLNDKTRRSYQNKYGRQFNKLSRKEN